MEPYPDLGGYRGGHRMARKAVLTCPNCGVKIEYITLHRGKVLGWHTKRERKT